MKTVAMVRQTGPPRVTGEGDWSGSRKGIGTKRIPLELGQEPFLPELVPPPHAGALVLEAPIECHCDPKPISVLYGGYSI